MKKLLLDECTPRVLKDDFTGHEVSTVEDAGVKGLKNGRLLRAASGIFDVLVTVDKSIPSQQNLAAFGLAVLILRAKSNRYEDLKPLIPQALVALENINPGDVITVKYQR
ncbi:MAG: hypothetical protein ACREEM_13960 [Blastocatellia bacterium]